MPIEDWTDGTKTYEMVAGKERTAVYFEELLVNSNAYYARAIATNGSFTVTATQGTAIGEPIIVSDAGGHSYFDLPSNDVTGTLVGSGGIASFTGIWSDPEENPTPGQVGGRVQITYAGSSMSIGSYTRYALCYHDFGTNFAPVSPADRIARQLRKQPFWSK